MTKMTLHSNINTILETKRNSLAYTSVVAIHGMVDLKVGEELN